MIEKILELMKSQNVTAAKLTKETNLPNSAITEWKKGKSKPSLDAIVKIADYFNVSVDYILDRTDMTRMKELRTEKGLSQKDVASSLGITQQAYANYERMARQADYETLKKLSAIFDCSIDYLLGTSDNPAHTQDTNSVDEEVVVYCRNGKTIRKKLTKEQMDYLDKFINSFSAEDYPDL